ncbi:MAG: hypothetical protein HOC91_17130 [Nitrospinaceae bacterium]|jgi:hypothetical protein|nr:hypothetical protein [Nitrospinaceae bacterium]MBT3434339.1 hypothetical protein [Nitrospinaceae bacterium]MBT3821705.1 hypothetical protein [Nitrospinaceae bacterium]MBT4094964.1 hypothetical protein [Nitrospinaceae bacterium]MBT4432235.1 hypothetical protein [Nitrospinaceae bacterium]
MADEEKNEAGDETPEEVAAPEVKDEAPAEGGDEAEPAVEETKAAPEAELPKITANEIAKMTVPKLKEAALQYGEKISGIHGMAKADLIRALKEVNDIPLVETRRASKLDRTAVKEKIKSLNKERDAALEDKDKIKLKRVRVRAKALRRKLIRNA